MSLMNAALALNVKQPPADTALLMVLAWRSQDGEGCTANVSTLARWSKLTVRSVQRCLASLERNGLIRREQMRKAHGMGWRYTVTFSASATGDIMSPVADDGDRRQNVTPTGDNPSTNRRQNVTPTGDRMSPNRKAIDLIKNSYTLSRARAREEAGDRSKFLKTIQEAAERLGLPRSFLFETSLKLESSKRERSRYKIKGFSITARKAESILHDRWERVSQKFYLNADQELYRDEGRKVTG